MTNTPAVGGVENSLFHAWKCLSALKDGKHLSKGWKIFLSFREKFPANTGKIQQ
jgi:hypothetical protein